MDKQRAIEILQFYYQQDRAGNIRHDTFDGIASWLSVGFHQYKDMVGEFSPEDIWHAIEREVPLHRYTNGEVILGLCRMAAASGLMSYRDAYKKLLFGW